MNPKSCAIPLSIAANRWPESVNSAYMTVPGSSTGWSGPYRATSPTLASSKTDV